LRGSVTQFVVRFPVRDEVCDLYILVAHKLRASATNQSGGLLHTFSYVKAPMALDVLSPLPRFDQGQVLLGFGDRSTAYTVQN
jgi:hypothetical protein